MRKLTVLCVLLVAVLSGCSQPSELHKAMESMGDAFKTMREEPNLEKFSRELPVFKEALQIAKTQPVKPEHQERFNEGLTELETGTATLAAAVASGDLALAVQNLQKLGEVRKKFHKELGVK